MQEITILCYIQKKLNIISRFFSAHVVRVTENYENNFKYKINARNKYIVFYIFSVTKKQYSSTVTPVAQ